MGSAGGSAGDASQLRGGSVLAATGASDTTPLVTLAAAALVAGGGALWATRRHAAHRTN
ncbi:LAETG motif-containing sortase-dependent surface protein [Streptomyces sp. NPDC047002]|uniref:LAETG motif-containing sortase-dependent surface protein n=1 Tax=Streptomyces sp. NPDC047002 TaxID=3155475 RepID=UPI00345277D1